MKNFSVKIHKLEDMMRGLGRNPLVDWRFALFCFAVLLGLVVIIDAFFYERLIISDAGNQTSSAEIKSFNRKDFDDVIKLLEDKNSNTKSIPRSVLSDPYIKPAKVSETPPVNP